MDRLIIALRDCEKSSTHEPDAETMRAAIVEIEQLRAQLAQARAALEKYHADTLGWIESFDWLGTGTSSKAADREQAAAIITENEQYAELMRALE